MEKIGFIGAYEKTDVIIYVAKILETLNKKVLVVDSTINQKAKYIVPTITPTKSYVTRYEDIDIAVGFEDLGQISEYLYLQNGLKDEYDYIFVDVDNINSLNRFNLQTAKQNYFVTSFDLYSLNKGLEALSEITETLNITKIYFSKNMLKEEDDYLNFLSLGYKIVWNNEKIYFPFDTDDENTIMENQRIAKVKFRGLSIQFKEGLAYLAEKISEQKNSEIKKAMKLIEKGV